MASNITHVMSDNQEVWDNMTDYLDRLLSKTYHSPVALMRAYDSASQLTDELYYNDQYYQDELTPVEQVSSHNLSLRLRDVHNVLEAQWCNPTLVANAAKGVRNMYLRFVQDIAPESEDVVYYSTYCNWFIEAVEAYLRTTSVHRSAFSAGMHDTIVATPAWAHDLLTLLGNSDPRGSSLRNFYKNRLTRRYGPNVAKYFPGFNSGQSYTMLSAPMRIVNKASLEVATSLWDPTDKSSVFYEFANAVKAAQTLA